MDANRTTGGRPFCVGHRRAMCTALGALLTIHAAMLAWQAWRYSPTIDEPAHLIAGMSHWKFGRFDLYRVNPPLVRLVASLPMLLVEPKTDWSGFTEAPYARPEFTLGTIFANANGFETFWHFTLARWACIPFSLIGGYFCFRWARDLYGAAAGITALSLWCFCPNILGNGALITPDVPAAACGVMAGYCFWRWLNASPQSSAGWFIRNPRLVAPHSSSPLPPPVADSPLTSGNSHRAATVRERSSTELPESHNAPPSAIGGRLDFQDRAGWPRALLAGLTLGLAELTKSTWIILFALWPLLWLLWKVVPHLRQFSIFNFQFAFFNTLVAGRNPKSPRLKGQGPSPKFLELFAIILIATYILNLGYGFENTFQRLDKFQFISHALGGPDAHKTPGNRFVNSWLGSLPVPVPANYLAGLDVQRYDFEVGKWSYLRGEQKMGGWWYYCRRRRFQRGVG